MIKINLLPKEARKRVGLGEQIAIIVLVLIVTFAGIGVYWSYLNNVIEEKREHIAQINARLQELQRIIDEIEQFKQRRAALMKKLGVIETLKKEQKMPVYFLNHLYLALEEDIWLRAFSQSGSLAIQDSQVNISATALSNPVAADYLRNLEQSPYFVNVNPVSITERRIGDRSVRDLQVTANLTTEGGMVADMFTTLSPKELLKSDETIAANMENLGKFMAVMLETVEEMQKSGELNTLKTMPPEEAKVQFKEMLKGRLEKKLASEDFQEFLQRFSIIEKNDQAGG